MVAKVLATFGPPAERRRMFVLMFEDPDMGNMYFHDEVEAVASFNRAKDAWTCTLFATMEVDDG